jgi:hypothetical protein
MEAPVVLEGAVASDDTQPTSLDAANLRTEESAISPSVDR